MIPPSFAGPQAGPSKRAIAPGDIPYDCCKNPECFRTNRFHCPLDFIDGCFVACLFCGVVDEAATQARNSVSVSEVFGAQMQDYGSEQTFDGERREYKTLKDKSFKDQIDGLFHTYLIDPKTSLLGIPAPPSFVKSAKWWYFEIRKAEMRERMKHLERAKEKGDEKALYQTNPAQNADARRINYQVCVAVKFATHENGVRVVNKRLGISSAPVAGFAKGDENIPITTAEEIFERANRIGPGRIGYLHSERFFNKVYRRCSRQTQNLESSLYADLFLLIRCVQRLREIVDMPNDERVVNLLTKPKHSKVKRSWADEDWSWFKRINWDELLPVGYNLYQAQQCISLWDRKGSAPKAIALTIWACQAVVGEPMPQLVNVSTELARHLHQAQWVAAERSVEMKNFLIAWSTSISDAGLPFPMMKLPRLGGLGDGVGGYGGDRRRRIPEPEMAATVAKTIADNWRKILQARIRTRYEAIPLDEEHDMARRLFVEHGEKMPKEEATARPPRRRTPLYLPVKASPEPSRTPSYRVSTDDAPPPKYSEAMTFARPPPEQTLEEMLASRDDSSAEGDADESDEGGHRVFGLGLTDLEAEKAPFAFSIGPDGFNVKKSTPFLKHVASSWSGSLLVVRQRSSSLPRSDTGFESIYETESMIPKFEYDFEQKQGHYAKVLRRAAERRTASRSGTPGSTLSTISRQTSLPVSPALSDNRPLRELSERIDDGSHVGQLIREREQYQTYRQAAERASGRLVSVEVELAMRRWVEAEKRKGTIPLVVSPENLASLGLDGDPRQTDLGPWIDSLREEMSPVEALLRIGIKPIEFPPHCITHSLIHLHHQLECYHSPDMFAPIGEGIDPAQLDHELELLFMNGEEKLDDVLLSEEGQAVRRQQIDEAGIWEDDDVPWRSRRAKAEKEDDEELRKLASAFEAAGEGQIQEVMFESLWKPEDECLSGDEDEEVGGRKSATKKKQRREEEEHVGSLAKSKVGKRKKEDTGVNGEGDTRPKKVARRGKGRSCGPVVIPV